GVRGPGARVARVLDPPTKPLARARVAPGLWEVSGVPGAKAPIRQCVADLLALAQFEHRSENCSRPVIRDVGNSATVEYTCPGGGFGRTEVGVVTPRSLRLDTQGISDGLPFHYVAQA